MSVPTDWWKNFFSGITLDMWRLAVSDDMTRTEADFIEKVLGLPPGAKILDVPCGGGRLSLALAARGYQLTGVDLANEFIAEARFKSAERQLNIAWRQGDMRELPWQEEFDGAFCFGNSFGYLDDDGNADFLNAVARTLKPGARLIVDIGSVAESLLPNFRDRMWYPIGDILFLANRSYDHVHGRLEIEYTFIRDGKVETKPASQRVYTYREICRLLDQAGFVGDDAYSSYNREPFKLGSPRLLLVAAKKGA